MSLEIDQGDDESFVITVKVPPNPPGTAADLTGCVLSFAARTSAALPPVISKSTGSGIVHRNQSGADKGIADMTIDAADTASLDSALTGRTLKCELQVVDTNHKTTTLYKGTLLINRDLVA